MKFILSFAVCLLLVSSHSGDSLYNIKLKSIDGSPIQLNQYRGKKLLFIILPVSAHDTTISMDDIVKLQTKYKSSVVFIGIPPNDAEYGTKDPGELRRLYKSAPDLVVTESMKVKKGAGQSLLFQWLTNKNMNRHFDHDAEGVGSKYFVDESGELYAVLGPHFKLTNSLIARVFSRTPQKKE